MIVALAVVLFVLDFLMLIGCRVPAPALVCNFEQANGPLVRHTAKVVFRARPAEVREEHPIA